MWKLCFLFEYNNVACLNVIINYMYITTYSQNILLYMFFNLVRISSFYHMLCAKVFINIAIAKQKFIFSVEFLNWTYSVFNRMNLQELDVESTDWWEN